MLLENLPFGRFVEIEPNLLEIFANDGVKLDQNKTALISEGLAEKYRRPYGIISNKWNSYSHTNGYISAISRQSNLVGLAILIHGSESRDVVEQHNLLHASNTMTFIRRHDAIFWLRQRLQDADNC